MAESKTRHFNIIFPKEIEHDAHHRQCKWIILIIPVRQRLKPTKEDTDRMQNQVTDNNAFVRSESKKERNSFHAATKSQ